MPDNSAPEGAFSSTRAVDVATRHVRHTPRAVEFARRIAPRLPYVADGRGRQRVPSHADAIREATRIGLEVLGERYGVAQ